MEEIATTMLEQMRQNPSGLIIAQLEAFAWHYQIKLTKRTKALAITACCYVDVKYVIELVIHCEVLNYVHYALYNAIIQILFMFCPSKNHRSQLVQ